MAIIVLPSGERRNCLIVNISEGGALLSSSNLAEEEIPDRFDLIIPADDAFVACRVAHMAAGRIGVEYVSLSRRASRILVEPNRNERISAIKANLRQK